MVFSMSLTRSRLLWVGWWAAIGAPSLGAQQPSAPNVGAESELCAEVLPAAAARLTASGSPRTPLQTGGRPDRPAEDLFCIELFGTARASGALGVAEINRPPSPFGVSISPDGQHLHDVTAWIDGLPDPGTLGDFSTYVAWATPLELDPVVRLGEVGNGKNELGVIAFNKYLVMVTAEADPDVSERSGPLVLRGRSPSARMEAHDMLAQAPSAEAAPDHTHGGAWRHPPMYADIPMLAGMMGLSPRVSPYLPEGVAVVDLPAVQPRETVRLPNGGTLDLVADFVKRTIGGRDIGMLAFNGQQPGPLIQVDQASTIFVNFENRVPIPTAVHWHGLRLDNRFDGVPGVTQEPIEQGESFRYQVHFPDAGIYWYHPHHREDLQQEMGLYGNMLVRSPDPGYYGPANHEEVLMLDDLLVGDEGLVPFGDESSNYMLMGRFGNTMLINGEPEWQGSVRRGDVVRYFFTNVSNTRTFNLSFRPENTDGDPLPIKVVATDVGRFEHEEFVRSVVIAPAERYVVDVRFPSAGRVVLTNAVQGINHRVGVFLPEVKALGSIDVESTASPDDYRATFESVRTHSDVVADIDPFRARFDDPPDRELVLTLEVNDLPEPVAQGMLYDWIYFNPVEWTGTMPMMNWASSGREVAWVLRDPESGAENMDIDWRFTVGDVVKIRVTNDRGAFHAMQHPLHIHGQRFLVVAQNGVRTENLAWKDTVLLPTGSTTDILLEVTNPGRWMVHCHIAEHLESGMKFVFDVEETP